jgi:hypothetical protein
MINIKYLYKISYITHHPKNKRLHINYQQTPTTKTKEENAIRTNSNKNNNISATNIMLTNKNNK